MSNKNTKNINVWNLVNKTKPENELQNINKKRKIILNNSQKLKNVQYKTSSVNKRQTEFNLNKLASINVSKYLSPVQKTDIPSNINQRTILTSIEYSNSFISNLNPVLWVDSSDLTSILRNSSNNVYQILDKSGNNNHLFQNTLANQPKYHNGGLLFNGNQYLTSVDTLNLNFSTISIIIALKQYNNSSEQGILAGLANTMTGDDNTNPNA
jgi:hypothetical protein